MYDVHGFKNQNRQRNGFSPGSWFNQNFDQFWLVLIGFERLELFTRVDWCPFPVQLVELAGMIRFLKQ